MRLTDPTRCFLIAEASGNHAQDYAKAEALVRAAADVGADAVKFQTFTPEEICADIPLPLGHDPQSDAWFARLGVTRMRELFAQGGLPRAWHAPLRQLAISLRLVFLSTPFSVEAARFLAEEVGVPALKIASGDLTFTPLLDYAATTRLPVILSTGGATLEEVLGAVHGPLDPVRRRGDLVVLHCASIYPAPPAVVNLRCIDTMRWQLGVPVGFSDHTLSEERVPTLAVAAGACVLEKHLALPDDHRSIDAGHSLPPAGFARMVRAIREAEVVLGLGVKAPHAAEAHDRLWARRDPSDWLRPTARAREGIWQ